VARLPSLFARAAEAARLIAGVPPYRIYREHMEQQHPGAPMMSAAEYFRDREQARYGGKGGGRCC
jgi:uncharacterized short protein YbdD (DUF466 family)